MKREKSCGAVIFKKDKDGNVLYLIEKMGLGHNSMCKGHVEANETEHETAIREIQEETSLEVTFYEGFREEIEYRPYNNKDVMKSVVFFLASPTDDRFAHDEHDDEVASISFFKYEEAYKLLTHETDKDVLRKANEFIINNRL